MDTARSVCILLCVCITLCLAAISCEPRARPTGESPPTKGQSESEKETMTVTIDGRDATPVEKAAFGAWTKKLLSDAIHKAINKGIEDFFQKLEINDPIEMELFSVPFGRETSEGDLLWSVYLIRPGKEVLEPRTTTIMRDGKPVIRFTRAIAPVERPVAIMSLTCTNEGRLSQIDAFLDYVDGKWKQYRPSERIESLK
jgi:hypothetical protein